MALVLKVHQDSASRKDIVAVESARWIAQQSHAGRAKTGLAAQKVADLNAKAKMRNRRLEIRSAAELQSTLVGEVVRKREMRPSTARADPRRNAGGRQKLGFD